MEFAAAELAALEMRLPEEWRKGAKTIDFGQMFSAVEDGDEEAASVTEVLEVLHAIWPADTLFKASDVLKQIDAPYAGEDGHAEILRSFFHAGFRNGGSLTAVSIGMRLKNLVGTPIWADAGVLKLVSIPGQKRRDAAMYKVTLTDH